MSLKIKDEENYYHNTKGNAVIVDSIPCIYCFVKYNSSNANIINNLILKVMMWLSVIVCAIAFAYFESRNSNNENK